MRKRLIFALILLSFLSLASCLDMTSVANFVSISADNSIYPSSKATDEPISAPLSTLTQNQTVTPTGKPSASPSRIPTGSPSTLPSSNLPSGMPTQNPSQNPSKGPTQMANPTSQPSLSVTSYQGLDLDIACLHAFCIAVDCLNNEAFQGDPLSSPTGKWDFTMNSQQVYSADPCQDKWFGIECANFAVSTGVTSKRVVSIYIKHRQLNGTLAPQLASMDHLSELDLSDNVLHGMLPDSFGSFGVNLRSITLSNNFLSGHLNACGLLANSSQSSFEFIDIVSSGISCYNECWNSVVAQKLFNGDIPECTAAPTSEPTSYPTESTPNPTNTPSSQPSALPSAVPTNMPTFYETSDMGGLEAFCNNIDCDKNPRFQQKMTGGIFYEYWNFTRNDKTGEYLHN